MANWRGVHLVKWWICARYLNIWYFNTTMVKRRGDHLVKWLTNSPYLNIRYLYPTYRTGLPLYI